MYQNRPMTDQTTEPRSLAASLLGKMAKGKPKRITEADRERRRAAMHKLNGERAARLERRRKRRLGLL